MSLYAEWLGMGEQKPAAPCVGVRPYLRRFGRGELRAKAMDAIRARPDSTLMELHAVVGGNVTTLASLLMRLRDEGAIVRRGKWRFYTYREAA